MVAAAPLRGGHPRAIQPRGAQRHAYFYPLTAQTLLPATGESALQEEENQKARKSNAAEENARPAPWRRSGGGKWRGRERLEGEGAGERGDAAHAG